MFTENMLIHFDFGDWFSIRRSQVQVPLSSVILCSSKTYLKCTQSVSLVVYYMTFWFSLNIVFGNAINDSFIGVHKKIQSFFTSWWDWFFSAIVFQTLLERQKLHMLPRPTVPPSTSPGSRPLTTAATPSPATSSRSARLGWPSGPRLPGHRWRTPAAPCPNSTKGPNTSSVWSPRMKRDQGNQAKPVKRSRLLHQQVGFQFSKI